MRRYLITLLLSLSCPIAAMAQPTLSKVFTPSTIGPGSVSTITFTITNGSAVPVTSLAFTDVLPVAITIADPANASTSCDLGVSGSLTAPDGGSTITLSDAQIGGSSSCTITVDVTASIPGAHTNPAVTLSSSAGSSMSLPIDLTVVTTLPGFSKSFAPSSVSLGGKSTLTFTIDNSLNPSRVGNLDFTDNLPSGILVAAPSNASTDCISASFPDTTLTAVSGTGVIILNADGSTILPGFEVLPAGGTCTVTVDVVATGIGMLDNVTNDLLADFTSAGKASDTLEVTITPLAIRKSFTDDPVPPGNNVTLEFVIDNFDRVFSATSVAFTDDLTTLVPALAGLTFDSLVSNDCGGSVSGVGGTTIGLSGATVAPEGSCTLVVSLSVPAGATPGSYTNTTSMVTGDVDGSPVVGNTASDDLFVEPVPILTKEFLEVGTLAPDPIINPGDSVILRFTITNTSATSAATDIAFMDELTDGGPGTGFLPFPVSVTLPPVPDPPCGVGSSLGFFFPDVDRQGLSLTGGSLAASPGPGDSCTFDVTVTVPATFPPGIYLNTTEEITATVDGATRTGDPASDTLTVIAAPSLTKEFTDDPVAPGNSVTVEFTLSYPADASGDATAIAFSDDLTTVLAGLMATSPGANTCTGSTVDISTPTTIDFSGGTLMPGESCTFSVTLSVPVGAAPGTYANTTSNVSATVQGLPATSSAASDDLSVSGLVFTKEFLGDPVIAGDTVTLRFTIANIHPTDDATITFFTDSLSTALAGLAATGAPSVNDCGGSLSGTTFLTYVGGSVLSGMMCTIEVEVLVPLASPDGTYTNITSSLVATQGGAVVVDPAIDDLVVSSTLLELTKAFTDDPVAPGDPVTLEFILTNLDAGQAVSMIDFSDDLGAALTGLTFDSVLFDDCGGTVSGTGTDMITVMGASLGAGGSCTLRVSLTVPGGAAAGVYPNTTSSLTGDIGGLAVTGDPASDDLVIIQLLDFSKSFDGPTTATGTATLTFTITNPGTDTATGISFTDDLDAVISGLIATTLPSVPCGPGSSISGIGLLTFSGGELASMDSCSIVVDVLIPASATAGTYPNTSSALFQDGLQVADPATADLVIEPPPSFTKSFAPSTIFIGGVSTMTFLIDNTASAVAASALGFTDNLPAGMTLATPANGATTCMSATVSAPDGGSTVMFSGGTVPAGATCTVTVNVVGTATGTHLNTTDDLISSAGNSGPASASLTVGAVPLFSKSFAPNPIALGAVSTLTFLIDNTASSIAASALDFTDNLPAGMTLATPANAATTCTGGTITAPDGGSTVMYSGGTVPASATCTVTVDVVGTAPGTHLNTTGDLTSSGGNSGSASDVLTVNPQPAFSKSFAPTLIDLGAVSTMTLSIDNTASSVAATGLDFVDNLPAGMAVATPANAATTCVGGTLTALAGGGTVSYSGGTVPASATCTVTVDVVGTADGTHLNVTGDLTSSIGNSGSASASLSVALPISLSKTILGNPVLAGTQVEVVYTVTNTSAVFGATGISFTDDFDGVLTGLSIVTLPPADPCGAGSSATGTSVLSLANGSVPAGGSCSFSVFLLVPSSAAPGTYPLTTTDFVATIGSTPIVGPPVSVDLVVIVTPTAIPTLDTLALALLALALALAAFRALRL